MIKHLISLILLAQPVLAANPYVRCSLPEPADQCFALGGELFAYRLANGTLLNLNYNEDFKPQAWDITQLESDFIKLNLPIRITHTFGQDLENAINVPVNFDNSLSALMNTVMVGNPNTHKIVSGQTRIKFDFFNIIKEAFRFRNFMQHENGHFYGLKHTQSSSSSMSPGGNSITQGMDFDMANGLLELYGIDNGYSLTVKIPNRKFNLGIENVDNKIVKVYKVSGFPKQHEVTVKNLPAGRYRVFVEPVKISSTPADFDNGENLHVKRWLYKTETGIELRKNQKSILKLGNSKNKRIVIK